MLRSFYDFEHAIHGIDGNLHFYDIPSLVLLATIAAMIIIHVIVVNRRKKKQEEELEKMLEERREKEGYGSASYDGGYYR